VNVFPGPVFYNEIDLGDVDLIAKSHLRDGRVVKHLLYSGEATASTDSQKARISSALDRLFGSDDFLSPPGSRRIRG
jgi:(2Fe-2S) ferredoxin